MPDIESVKLQAAYLNNAVGELRTAVTNLLADEQAVIPKGYKHTLETLIEQIPRFQDDLDGALGNPPRE